MICKVLRNSAKGARNRARYLRKNMSVPERLLWSQLCKNRIGFRVLNQHTVGNYTLDFYVPDALLCIEVDGIGHRSRIDSDGKRDKTLDALGILTIRISTLRIRSDSYGCAIYIKRICCERAGRDFSD
jgi:very-short-patch-repair endonuclease